MLVKNPEKAEITDINVADAEKFLNKIDHALADVRDKISKLNEKKQALDTDYAILAPFKTLNYTLKRIYDMEFFKYRFGKIPSANFDKFETYLDPDIDAIFVSTLTDSEYVYGVFFAPIDYFEDVEKDFNNIHFDEIQIPKKYTGFPNDECVEIFRKKDDIYNQIDVLNKEIDDIIEKNKNK